MDRAGCELSAVAKMTLLVKGSRVGCLSSSICRLFFRPSLFSNNRYLSRLSIPLKDVHPLPVEDHHGAVGHSRHKHHAGRRVGSSGRVGARGNWQGLYAGRERYRCSESSFDELACLQHKPGALYGSWESVGLHGFRRNIVACVSKHSRGEYVHILGFCGIQ